MPTLPLDSLLQVMRGGSKRATVEGMALLHGVLHPEWKDFAGLLRLGYTKLPSLGLGDGDRLVICNYPLVVACTSSDIQQAVLLDDEDYIRVSRGPQTRVQVARMCFGTLRDIYFDYRDRSDGDDVWRAALHTMYHMEDVVPRAFEKAYAHALERAGYQEASDC